MRFSLAALSLAITAAFLTNVASAQQEASLQERLAVRRDLSQAKNNLRYYWQVEYPRQRRNLDGVITLTEIKLKNLNTQLRQFRPFTQFSIGQPFPITIRNLEMCIRETELSLNDLISERNALIRFHSEDFNALAADVYEARLRVLALEPSESVAVDPTAETLPLQ